MNPKITPEHLSRGASVYIRQSTVGQVVEHTESQRTELGAKHVGILQSLLTTCRLHNVDPYDYLVDVLHRIDRHPAASVDQLTPRLWKEHFGKNPFALIYTSSDWGARRRSVSGYGRENAYDVWLKVTAVLESRRTKAPQLFVAVGLFVGLV